ncbi:MAG TPA: hypothetical protein VLA14_09775 [Polyangia bacterium]|nr:hypothetical protein [Polyangia bacterium]
MASTRVAAISVLALALAACDGRALEPAGPAGASVDSGAPLSLTIPAFVVPPVLSCGRGVGAVPLASPCQIGRGPVFEVDCAYGAALDQVIRFMLAPSLFLPGGFPTDGQAPPLGAPLAFDATFVPTFATLPVNGEVYQLTRMNGTLTLTKGSFGDRTLDGWFTHLDFAWTAGGDTLTCTLDNGRFSTIPGAYE